MALTAEAPATYPTQIRTIFIFAVACFALFWTGHYFASNGSSDRMQLVIIDRHGQLAPLLRITGQDSLEIAGPAFSPDEARLYFSSQRGGPAGWGITYEVSGPFGRFVG